MFRGGPYGGDNDYAGDREKEHGPFPEHGPDEGFLMGARNVEPVNGGGDWVVAKPEHWIFDGTGMKKGDRIPGLIGWEYHGDPPDIPGLEVVAAGTAWVRAARPRSSGPRRSIPGPRGTSSSTPRPSSGPRGSRSPPGHTLPWSHWSRPHGPDERVQQITHNLLRDRRRNSSREDRSVGPSGRLVTNRVAKSVSWGNDPIPPEGADSHAIRERTR